MMFCGSRATLELAKLRVLSRLPGFALLDPDRTAPAPATAPATTAEANPSGDS
jgi:hypothetical protein